MLDISPNPSLLIRSTIANDDGLQLAERFTFEYDPVD